MALRSEGSQLGIIIAQPHLGRFCFSKTFAIIKMDCFIWASFALADVILACSLQPSLRLVEAADAVAARVKWLEHLLDPLRILVVSALALAEKVVLRNNLDVRVGVCQEGQDAGQLW